MRSFFKRLKKVKLSLRQKIVLSLSSIAMVLVISSLISILEYSRMSNYVSSLIEADVNSINIAQKLSIQADEYHLELFNIVADREDSLGINNEAAVKEFQTSCDSLRRSMNRNKKLPLTDSVMTAFLDYVSLSSQMDSVMRSDSINTRLWFTDNLRPSYNHLKGHIDALNTSVYDDLSNHSSTFERGFYRSLIPGFVAVCAGIVLVIMLIFFINSDYVTPIYRMLSSLSSYRSSNKPYTYEFDGDDQLAELNEGVREITEENRMLHKRISMLKERKKNEC